jgi:hypothetical protein
MESEAVLYAAKSVIGSAAWSRSKLTKDFRDGFVLTLWLWRRSLFMPKEDRG